MRPKNQTTDKVSFAERLSRGIDRFVGIFSPEHACRMLQFRAAHQVMLSVAYRGARNTRLTNSWSPGGGSADEDLLPAHASLRERSRDLDRNNPYASGIVNTVNTNTIGSGISPQSRLNPERLGISKEQASEYQAQIELVWKRWSKQASADDRLNIVGVQQLIDRQILLNGEMFILPLMIDDPTRYLSLALDLIESDRVDTPFSRRSDRSIRNGIKIGDRGQPIEYYIRSTHPGDLMYRDYRQIYNWQTYKARNPQTGRKNIFHLYEMRRPGQSRGVPFFAPVIEKFKHLDEYLEAELVAARVAACFAIFVKSTDASNRFTYEATETNSQSQRERKVSPAMISYLKPGEEISSFNPNRPNQSFDVFVMQMLRMIASSLNLSYELVAKDFTKSNYSNTRASFLQAFRYFRSRQAWFSQIFLQPIFEMVIEEAYLKSKIRLPRFYQLKEEWLNSKWVADGFEWVDPQKEIKAAIESVGSNLNTLSDICAERGKDWEEVMVQNAKELAKKKELEGKYGVQFSADKTQKIPKDLIEDEPKKEPEEED